MIVFTEKDRQMLQRVVSEMRDRTGTQDGYTEQDGKTLDKLDQLSKAPASVLLVTAEDQDADARHTFQRIVQAELSHWVPNASQRLLFRAGRVLGFPQPNPAKGLRDCGPERDLHSLMNEWAGEQFLYRCTNCYRLFQD